MKRIKHMSSLYQYNMSLVIVNFARNAKYNIVHNDKHNIHFHLFKQFLPSVCCILSHVFKTHLFSLLNTSGAEGQSES